MYRNGVGTAANREKSAHYIERACALDPKVGCNDFGVIFFDGYGVSKNHARAKELFDRACAHGSVLGCVHRSLVMKERAEGGVPDPLDATAFAILRKACIEKNTHDQQEWHPFGKSLGACTAAGRMQREGRGVAADAKAARALYAQGCSHEDSSACAEARAHDGEECSTGCRGTESHSSSCVDGLCARDLDAGASCADGKRSCTRGTFCNEARTCEAARPYGAPCLSPTECATRYCANSKCDHPPVVTN